LRKAVFLDRDGVINEAIVRGGKPYPPPSPDELVIVPGTQLTLERLNRHSFLLIVITNQPDVARGIITRKNVEEINHKLSSQLPLDDFFICYHDDSDNCGCRKPKPGLLLEAAAKYQIDLAASFFIGDRWRDIEAGIAAGCRTVLIDRCYNERSANTTPDVCVRSLSEAADWILNQRDKGN
jgi:D-glycero-D-manno-heptose 1,7-bisphosphate phosphatase